MRRLVADAMLSKLARWLRLAGISVENAPAVDDEKIIRYAKRNEAVLLTSDKALARRAVKRKFKALLIKEGDLEHQIAFVAKALDLDISRYPGRICPICNGKLKRVSKSKVKGKVEAEAYKNYSAFYACEKCGKIYWYGTHWKVITRRLEKANSILSKMQEDKKI